MQSVNFFGQQESVLERRFKRRSVTSMDDIHQKIIKEPKMDVDIVSPVWCPSSTVAEQPMMLGPSRNMYSGVLSRYREGMFVMCLDKFATIFCPK